MFLISEHVCLGYICWASIRFSVFAKYMTFKMLTTCICLEVFAYWNPLYVHHTHAIFPKDSIQRNIHAEYLSTDYRASLKG